MDRSSSYCAFDDPVSVNVNSTIAAVVAHYKPTTLPAPVSPTLPSNNNGNKLTVASASHNNTPRFNMETYKRLRAIKAKLVASGVRSNSFSLVVAAAEKSSTALGGHENNNNGNGDRQWRLRHLLRWPTMLSSAPPIRLTMRYHSLDFDVFKRKPTPKKNTHGLCACCLPVWLFGVWI